MLFEVCNTGTLYRRFYSFVFYRLELTLHTHKVNCKNCQSFKLLTNQMKLLIIKLCALEQSKSHNLRIRNYL